MTGIGSRARSVRSVDDEVESGKTALDRLVFFSDAVCAIAITLLVLPLANAQFSDRHIGAQLLDQWPKIFSFVLSFIVIGTYWMIHHRMFRFILRLDTTLLKINMLFLLCVVFLPFPTSVLGEHEARTATVVLYAVAISLTGLTTAALWQYACHHHRLISPSLSYAFIRAPRLRGLVIPAVFLASVPVAFVDPTVAMYVWIAALPASIVIGRLHKQAEGADLPSSVSPSHPAGREGPARHE